MKSDENRVDVLPAGRLAETPARATSRATATSLAISETFVSRQGEGILTGTDSVFIRTSGCNLRCWFCDTPYASWHPESTPTTIDELVDLVDQSGLEHVVLTGGEPLVAAGIGELVTRLHASRKHITIETAGTVDPGVPCDLLSLSPKLRASTPNAAEHTRWAKLHAERRLPIDVMRGLIAAAPVTQVKFVVDSPNEITEIDDVVSQLGVEPETVWLMPQGVTNEQLDVAKTWLQPLAAERNHHYCDRMQIRWYGNRRGT